jgi:hypothetical protein
MRFLFIGDQCTNLCTILPCYSGFHAGKMTALCIWAL